jgi:hypothetical protein
VFLLWTCTPRLPLYKRALGSADELFELLSEGRYDACFDGDKKVGLWAVVLQDNRKRVLDFALDSTLIPQECCY